MKCPETEKLLLYLDSNLPDREMARLGDHLEACSNCSDTMAFLKAIKISRDALQTGQVSQKGECPDAEIMGAFLEGRLSQKAAADLKDHLIDCDKCLLQTLSLRSTLYSLQEGIKVTPPELLNKVRIRTVKEEVTLKDRILNLFPSKPEWRFVEALAAVLVICFVSIMIVYDFQTEYRIKLPGENKLSVEKPVQISEAEKKIEEQPDESSVSESATGMNVSQRMFEMRLAHKAAAVQDMEAITRESVMYQNDIEPSPELLDLLFAMDTTKDFSPNDNIVELIKEKDELFPNELVSTITLSKDLSANIKEMKVVRDSTYLANKLEKLRVAVSSEGKLTISSGNDSE